eukprot:4201195-Amphidinium_carterae.1
MCGSSTCGSALWPRSRSRRRAGWSVVMLDSQGRIVRAMYGPLPFDVAPEQTVRCAEDYAVRKAILHGVGDLRIHIDCAGTVRAAQRATRTRQEWAKEPRAHMWALWSRYPWHLEAIKVRAHLTMAQAGSDAKMCYTIQGNATADRLAKKGAASHGVTEWHVMQWRQQEQRQKELSALA